MANLNEFCLNTIHSFSSLSWGLGKSSSSSSSQHDVTTPIVRGPSENRNKKERERNVVLSFFNKNDGKNLRKLSRMQGTSVIDDAETSEKIRRYRLRTRICRGLQKKYIHLFTLHRTQTDVTFVKYFIMFHGHRKLIINYNQ